MLLEICVDSVESAIAAERGGAGRVELCSDLLEGGITPSAGLIQIVREQLTIGVTVMVRPRGGDFFYTGHEFDAMKADIRHAKLLGVDGVVLGILDADGRVDVARTRELVALAAPLPVTFHRAIDVSADFKDSLDRVMASGARRVLTSGGKWRVADSLEHLAAAVLRTQGRVTIMAGGGLNPENIRMVAEKSGVVEYHSGLNARIPSPVRYRNDSLFLGTDMDREYSRYVVREEDVRTLREELDRVERQGSRSGAQGVGLRE